MHSFVLCKAIRSVYGPEMIIRATYADENEYGNSKY